MAPIKRNALEGCGGCDFFYYYWKSCPSLPSLSRVGIKYQPWEPVLWRLTKKRGKGNNGTSTSSCLLLLLLLSLFRCAWWEVIKMDERNVNVVVGQSIFFVFDYPFIGPFQNKHGSEKVRQPGWEIFSNQK